MMSEFYLTVKPYTPYHNDLSVLREGNEQHFSANHTSLGALAAYRIRLQIFGESKR